MNNVTQPREEEIRKLAHEIYAHRGGNDGWDVADWLTAEKAIGFHKVYERVILVPFQNEKRIYLGTKEDRTCRYCLKTRPAVTFRKDAHAVPAFLGNLSSFTYYECDSCNEAFGEYLEDHFAKALHGVRSALRIKGRSAVPSYKTTRKLSRIDIDDGNFKIAQYTSDPMATMDQQDQSLNLDLESQPFIPLAMYKCLAKIGLSIMPAEELQHFMNLKHWILTRDHSLHAADFQNAFAYRSFCPGPFPSRYGWAELFRRRSDAIPVPYMALVVTTMNLTFQIYLPLSQNDYHLHSSPLRFPIFPVGIGMGYEYGEPHWKMMNLSSAVSINADINVSMHADAMIRNPPPSNAGHP